MFRVLMLRTSPPGEPCSARVGAELPAPAHLDRSIDVNRPLPLVPEDQTRPKHARGAVYVCRAACAHLRGFVTGATPTNAAKSMFGGDSVTDLILQRAASSPAAIS